MADCNGFCGRLCLIDNVTDCRPCPWGWKVNKTQLIATEEETYRDQLCSKCDDQLDSYDWLFIFFNYGMVFLLHSQAILRFSVTTKRSHIVELIVSIAEISFGFLLSILVYSPTGSFNLDACYYSKEIRSDIVLYWYQIPNTRPTLYFNPFQSNAGTKQCVYEIVYPRFSLILCAVSLSLIFTVFCHPTALHIWNRTNPEYYERLPHYYNAFSSIMLLYPIYVATFVVTGGIFYYLYNFVMLIFALVGVSFYLSYVSNNNLKFAFKLKNRFKHLPAVICHFLLLAVSLWSFHSRQDTSGEKKYVACFVLPCLSIGCIYQQLLCTRGFHEYD